MKSFHKTMGLMAGVFLLMIILSLSVASSYMTKNDILFESLFLESADPNYHGSYRFTWNGLFGPSHRASDYETVTIEESESFGLAKELFVSSTIESISFIEEDRSDILVEYYRELPDSKLYDVNYSTSESENKLNITATLKIGNMNLNRTYGGEIKIHLPKDYHFDKVTVDTGMAKIRSANIYTDTDELSVIASFGDIDVVIEQPIRDVNVSCNFGSIDLRCESTIDNLDVDCDMGSIDLEVNAPISQLDVTENMGDVNLNASAEISHVDIVSNMGTVRADFLETVGGMDLDTNMGDVDVYFYENADMHVHADTDLGNVKSDFPIVSAGKTDFRFTSNMGSVSVHKR